VQRCYLIGSKFASFAFAEESSLKRSFAMVKADPFYGDPAGAEIQPRPPAASIGDVTSSGWVRARVLVMFSDSPASSSAS
jgi:hypothetical protein